MIATEQALDDMRQYPLYIVSKRDAFLGMLFWGLSKEKFVVKLIITICHQDRTKNFYKFQQ